MDIEIFYVDLTGKHASHEINIPFFVSPPGECDFMLSQQYNNSTLYNLIVISYAGFLNKFMLIEYYLQRFLFCNESY